MLYDYPVTRRVVLFSLSASQEEVYHVPSPTVIFPKPLLPIISNWIYHQSGDNLLYNGFKIAAHRIFYVLVEPHEFLLLHAYKKQGQKLPLKEREVAIKRMKEVLS